MPLRVRTAQQCFNVSTCDAAVRLAARIAHAGNASAAALCDNKVGFQGTFAQDRPRALGTSLPQQTRRR
eukprot:CAMPEP_0174841356 /NCGR_PEP_ID=MMETSP1114-20130205/9263_1 /TAXON_ID=312471 /ORGANISM="Neobodo designis, Strain CCAP 1951/1" /LENGTH=68 /DNA_ID=CAMNT_0016075537 /DNA_START=187 /DNA_END=393 /DNA_ORIENTATION=-